LDLHAGTVEVDKPAEFVEMATVAGPDVKDSSWLRGD
jgi:hypothetical protein